MHETVCILFLITIWPESLDWIKLGLVIGMESKTRRLERGRTFVLQSESKSKTNREHRKLGGDALGCVILRDGFFEYGLVGTRASGLLRESEPGEAFGIESADFAGIEFARVEGTLNRTVG